MFPIVQGYNRSNAYIAAQGKLYSLNITFTRLVIVHVLKIKQDHSGTQ